jgi:hypothetical protein
LKAFLTNELDWLKTLWATTRKVKTSGTSMKKRQEYFYREDAKSAKKIK